MGFFSSSKPDLPPNLPTFDEGAVVHATFKTSEGDFKAKLHAAECPITVGNFVGLATGQIPWTDPNTGEPAGRPLYDGTIFHRVIDDFMIQGGDFTNGDGTGGHAAKWFGYCNGAQTSEAECAGQTSYTIPDEADNGRNHEPCTISMAKTSAANTGGSQFFLIPNDSTPNWLDGQHTVFGEITSGCNHVTAISATETGQNDRPVQDVELVSATFVGSETTPWYQFW